MEVRSWIFEYADDVHIVELEHDTENGRRIITVNRLLVVDDEDNNRHGGVYKFKIGDLPCMLYIRYTKDGYQYDFYTMKSQARAVAS